jgi:hypothetical protein
VRKIIFAIIVQRSYLKNKGTRAMDDDQKKVITDIIGHMTSQLCFKCQLNVRDRLAEISHILDAEMERRKREEATE